MRRISKRHASFGAYAATTAVVILLATTAQGQTATQVELNDGGVWAVNGAEQAVGRLNYDLGQLDATDVPRGSKPELDVFQDGAAVVVWDSGNSKLYGVDVAAGRLSGEGSALTSGAQVALAGGSLATLTPKGELRATRLDQVTTPNVSTVAESGDIVAKGLKAPARLAIGADGTVVVLSADAMVRLDPVGASFRPAVRAERPSLGDSVALTMVGSTPVALDGSSVVDLVENKRIDLPKDTGYVLQQSGPGNDQVAVAGDRGLYVVPLGGGEPRVVTTAGTGLAAAPAWLGSCVYSAWGGGDTATTFACGSQPAPSVEPIPGALGSRPVFRLNRGHILINDTATGALIKVEGGVVELKDVWKAAQDPQDRKTKTRSKKPAKGKNRPPTPENDNLGARPGRVTQLHVLDNDTDPEQQLLVIDKVDAPDTAGVTAVSAPDGQSLLLTVPAAARGTTHVKYYVNDGRGGTAAATATVAITPLSARDGRPAKRPHYSAKLSYGVAPAGTLRIPVLADWRDPEGDPLLLTAVKPAGQVVATADGSLVVSASALPGRIRVNYAVTDGLSAPVPGPPVQVDVLSPAGPEYFRKPLARPDAVRVVVGQPAVVKPLENDLPGADATERQAKLFLAHDISAQPGFRITTDVVRGTVTLLATQPGSREIPYDAAFGGAPTSQSTIRVDALPASSASHAPVTLPDTAVLRGTRPVTVDVLNNDYDPDGGLLQVQDAVGGPDSGLSAAVIDGKSVRIEANDAQGGGEVTYRVTNGRGVPVVGSISVTVIPDDSGNAAPVAVDDPIVVRAGDPTGLEVLDNDFDPDGDVLALSHAAPPVAEPALPGAFVGTSGRSLRYSAPADVKTTTTVAVSYVVTDGLASTTGRALITIRPRGSAKDNQPPAPKDIEARLVSGDTFQVRVPVYGVDPDGDAVSVSGIAAPPKLGRVVSIGADTITYQSFPDRSGTDQLSYEVVDAFGQSGTALVRFSIAAPGTLAGPLAVPDEVTAQPGRTVHLDVTENDLVAPGAVKSVAPIEDTNSKLPSGADQDGRTIFLKAPDTSGGSARVDYTLTDGSGTGSTTQFVVRAAKDVVIPPLARDDVPAAEADLTKPLVVDVLKNDDDPDGSELEIVGSGAGGEVKDGKLVVQVLPEPHQVVYQIKDEDGATAMAVVRVPGSARDKPYLKPGARIVVPAGGKVNQQVNDLVVSPSGAPVMLTTTTADHFGAAPAGQVTLSNTGSKTLHVQATGRYVGPASVFFEVTDGKSIDAGRRALIAVPVQVGEAAPYLRCPSTPVDLVEGGKGVTLDIPSYCHVWIDSTVPANPVSYAKAVSTQGISAGLSKTRLTLSAASGTKPGTQGVVTVTATSGGGSGSAKLPFRVKKAGPPQGRSVSLNGIKAGTAVKVDAKNAVTSPLADPKIVIVSATQTLGGKTVVEKSGSVLTFTADRDTHGPVRIELVVTDVSADRTDRRIRVLVNAVVQSRPSPPGPPTVLDIGNRFVQLGWSPASANGSEILGYRVKAAGVNQVCRSSPCPLRNLDNGTTYRFQVEAFNAVGTSDLSPAVSARPAGLADAVPALVARPSDRRLDVSWGAPNAHGSTIKGYQVQLSPGGQIRTVQGRSTPFTGLSNGTKYKVTVRPISDVKPQGGLGGIATVGPSSDTQPFGRPTAAAPKATSGEPADADVATINVRWSPADGNGRDISSYTVTGTNKSTGATFTKTGTPAQLSSAGQLQVDFPVATNGNSYTFVVRATNAGGLTSPDSAPSASVAAIGKPRKVASVEASDHDQSGPYNSGDLGAIKASFALPEARGATLTHVDYQTSLGSKDSRTLSGGATVALTIEGFRNAENPSVKIQVRACARENCGAWSEWSNTVHPYGRPHAPAAFATRTGPTSARFTWGGGGGNGRPLRAGDTYKVCITTRPCVNRSDTGPIDVDFGGYQLPYSISVTAFDSTGQESPAGSDSDRTDNPPAPPAPSSWAVTANVNTCPQPDFNFSRYKPGPPATCSAPGGFIPRYTALTVTCYVPKNAAAWGYGRWYRISGGWTSGYHVADGTVNGNTTGIPQC